MLFSRYSNIFLDFLSIEFKKFKTWYGRFSGIEKCEKKNLRCGAKK